MGTIKKILICSLSLIISQISFATAEVGRKTPDSYGTVSAGPYYNPASKSYFELFRMQKIPGMQTRWFGAKILAEKLYFKNTQGRLATVKNLATHQFFIQHFKGNYIWIGLQYFCATQSLKWVDGTILSESDFNVWSNNWARGPIRCGEMGYMPVSYTTDYSTNDAARWQATGPNKAYRMYLVEYPTGKE